MCIFFQINVFFRLESKYQTFALLDSIYHLFFCGCFVQGWIITSQNNNRTFALFLTTFIQLQPSKKNSVLSKTAFGTLSWSYQQQIGKCRHVVNQQFMTFFSIVWEQKSNFYILLQANGERSMKVRSCTFC